jgi:hypothetical protein
MRRREFTAGLLLAAVRSATAQQRAIPRIALFHPAIPTTLLTETGGGTAWRAFFGELRRLGYVEGQSLIIERYSAEGHHERYADIAQEIVGSNPDLIERNFACIHRAQRLGCPLSKRPRISKTSSVLIVQTRGKEIGIGPIARSSLSRVSRR